MSSTNKTKKSERDDAIYDLTHGRAVYIIAFMVPLVIMIAIFIIRDIYPFGDQTYLRSDMYHQYAPFFSELWEKLRNGESLSYSWNIGLGTNFIAIFGYYLSSPSNFLIALFPQEHITELMNAIILLKLAAASLTCTIYLCYHNHNRHISAAIFGLFYGLSGFIAAYSWNLMWLDCVLLLPLVVLGLEKLILEGKGILYAITLGLTILSNYYIAIMVCMAMIIYFFVIIISMPIPKDKSDYAKKFLHFVGYSILAGGLASILLFPEVYAFEYTASSNINFPTVLTRYFSFITIIKRQLLSVPVSTGLDHLPNIYAGVAVFFLLPMYLLSPKISKREKSIKMLAIVAFFVAFNMNKLNFIWHGFHYPNSLPCRQSFIYIFLLLSICYDAVIHIKDTKESSISGSFWGVILFFLYLGNSLTDESTEISFTSIYISAIFIAIYIVLIFFYKKNTFKRDYLMIFIFSIAVIECTMNMENTGYSTTSRVAYMSDYESVETLLDHVSEYDDSFYRTTKYRGYRSKNDDAWHNFQGVSIFSSTAYASLTSLYDSLGLESSTNSYAINGATPLIYSLFDVKYFLSNSEIQGDLYTLTENIDGEYLYTNEHVLPLAFMVPSYFNQAWTYDSSNPFDVQNNLAYYAADVENLFTPVYFQDNITNATIVPSDDMYLYLYISNKSIDKISVTIDNVTETFTGINHGRTVDIGYVKAGSNIYITDAEDGGLGLQMFAYELDVDKYYETCDNLSSNGLEITSYDNTSIYGTIDVSSNGMLFTTIPYDESYTVYVDNVKTSYTSIGENAFIAFYLESGTHTIEFQYQPRGLIKGAIISIICLIILLLLIIFAFVFKREITENNSISYILTKLNSKKNLPKEIDQPVVETITVQEEPSNEPNINIQELSYPTESSGNEKQS